MPSTPVRVRSATIEDLTTALEWADAEGWNPGVGDAEAFLAADPTGFCAAESDDGLVGTVSAVRYDDHFAFCGLFLARADRRHLGIGHELVEAGLQLVGDRVAGLDGVVAQQRNYRSMGFEFQHRSIRYSGPIAAAAAMPAEVSAVEADDVDDLIAADRRWFPAPRRAFLERWLDGTDGRSAVLARHGSAVTGYAVVRRCRSGWKVGPLFAVDASVAEALFVAAMASTDGVGPIALDVPEPNDAAVRLAERWGLVPVFETARMYLGPAPDLRIDEIFGITSFELG